MYPTISFLLKGKKQERTKEEEEEEEEEEASDRNVIIIEKWYAPARSGACHYSLMTGGVRAVLRGWWEVSLEKAQSSLMLVPSLASSLAFL